MPLPVATRIECENCKRLLTRMPGDASKACKDRVKCEARKKALAPPPPAPAPPASPPAPHTPENDPVVAAAEAGPCEEDGLPRPMTAIEISLEQKRLAGRAVTVTRKVIDKIEDAITNGTTVIAKDGTTSQQPVPPMALASILRELRPVVQEPVRAAEAEDLSNRPLIALDLNDPRIVRAAVEALRARRERQALAQYRPEPEEVTTRPAAERTVSSTPITGPTRALKTG